VGGLVRRVTERPLATISVVVVLALAGVALALQLEPSASTDSLVGESTPAAKATKRFHEQFGDESIVVLVRGDLQRSVLTHDLLTLLKLEGCLSGNAPRDRPELLAGLPPECTTLARLKPVKVVYGPGTFVNTAANQITGGYLVKQREAQQQANSAAAAARQLALAKGYSKKQADRFANEARKLANQKFTADLLKLALRYGLTSPPSLSNVSFVSQLIFDTTRGLGQPKARFAYLFPSKRAASILIRLKPDLSDAQRERAIGLIRRAVYDKAFKLDNGLSSASASAMRCERCLSVPLRSEATRSVLSKKATGARSPRSRQPRRRSRKAQTAPASISKRRSATICSGLS
jgi:hypothetical protein